ncbi:class I SAM-dependent methyltransferase [Mucilaginibacter pankratovii]|uniref:class I SAM-dependent methyltransferase n=1 Tax=Mucilaginibacter pankratovii TaxID=2772110 RepID=UPI001CD16FEA|nr:class I SAM-dependent methyltransferase [Mucilaginibacter pankratovii]
MLNVKHAWLLLYALAVCFKLSAQQTGKVYTYKSASAGGEGKFYLGREIAQVMSFDGAAGLERDSRQREENAELAISKLPISKNSIVADIGAGTGYYTFRIAPKLAQGKIYAVEIQDDAIKYLINKSRQLQQNNVTVIKGGERSTNLPANAIDLAIMVDVYHELLYPQEMLQAIRLSLKPKGKLLLLEYRAEDPGVPIKVLHKMSVAQVNKEMKANGFHWCSAANLCRYSISWFTRGIKAIR